jgi:hypothetical protein
MLGRFTIAQTFLTTAAPAAVWAAIEDAPRWPLALTDLADARIEPNGVLAPGAVIHTVAKPGTAAVDMTYDVVQAENPHRLAIETRASGTFYARTEYLIEPEGTGARVSVTTVAEPLHWLHKLTVALRQRWYADYFANTMSARVQAMLALAEQNAAQMPGR